MAAAGEAVLQYIDAHGLVERAATPASIWGGGSQALRALPIVGDVRGLGLLWGIEIVRDKATKVPFARALQVSERVAYECFVARLLVVPGAGAADGLEGDTITLAPPLTIAKEEIDELVALLDDAIRAVGLIEQTARRPLSSELDGGSDGLPVSRALVHASTKVREIALDRAGSWINDSIRCIPGGLRMNPGNQPWGRIRSPTCSMSTPSLLKLRIDSCGLPFTCRPGIDSMPARYASTSAISRA